MRSLISLSTPTFTFSDPDGPCLRLLESMAVELSDQLDSSEQITFLSAAASCLEYTAGDVTGSTV